MIKQTLKQYLNKLVDYNKRHEVCTVFMTIETCIYKHTLIKRTINIKVPISMKIFRRYMNNSGWEFYD